MNDYPSDADLDFIANYSLCEFGPQRLIDHIASIWHWPDYCKWTHRENQKKGQLELHTGGWSGNEDIIEALRTTEFWLLYWMKSERGGHYWFEI